MALPSLDALSLLNSTEIDDVQAQTILAHPGWGAFASAFTSGANEASTWGKVGQALHGSLTGEQMASARESVDNSYFTPSALVDALWSLLGATGFTGGTVLEPGCGTGRVIHGAPDNWDLSMVGVESDPASADLAALLNPSATIIKSRMERWSIPDGSFDAMIGNIPFGKGYVWDAASRTGYSSVHAYFTARSIRAVRPGGFLVFLTSRSFIDSQSFTSLTGVRFCGALRLPDGVFKGEGTNAGADLVVLQRLASVSDPMEGADAFAGEHGSLSTGSGSGFVSAYWDQHPEFVLGDATLVYRLYPTVEVSGSLDVATLDAAVKALGASLPSYVPPATPTDFLASVITEDEEGRKEGSFHLMPNGKVGQVRDGQLTETSRQSKEIGALIELRDLAVDLIEHEANDEVETDALESVRKAAREAYERYVSAYGALNRGTLTMGAVDPETGSPTYTWRTPQLGGFRADPDYVLVMALEQFDQSTNEHTPAPILMRRVNHPVHVPTSADNVDDALVLSLNQRNTVDVDYIASLLETEVDEAKRLLVGKAFCDPVTGQWERASRYLSGNIRVKLDEACRAGAGYEENVRALTEVMPVDLGPLDIRITLGAAFIPSNYITDFAREMGFSVGVDYDALTGSWEVEDRHCSPEARHAWGVGFDMSPARILSNALNAKIPEIFDDTYDAYTGKAKKVKNAEKTSAAIIKLDEMNAKFALWIWEDETRTAVVCSVYNERFNSHVGYSPNGDHLTFPGMSEAVVPWKHQRDAVDRNISSPRTMIAHAVGAGKTLTAILTAFTLRRLGLASKPLMVVPNHLLEQISREAQQAFPVGRFLIASKEDLSGERRRLFAARCATGDWDMVVMTQAGFNMIRVSDEAEEAFLARQISIYEGHLMSSNATAKKVATGLKSMRNQIAKMRSGKTDPNTVSFEQLGVDYLMVDEAQAYKNLKAGGRELGFAINGSKRATDMHLKIMLLGEQREGAPAVSLYTGTPFSNSLAEMYTWQTFLQPERLAAAEVSHFAAWLSTFVQFTSQIEVKPDGSGFRMNRRPTVIQNYAELIAMFTDVADIVMASDIDVERPEATWENIVSDPSDEQSSAIIALSERAEALSKKTSANRNDNMLLICTDGRKIALDPALAGYAGGSPKLEAAAKNIAKVYHESKHLRYDNDVLGALQLAFCDYGTPNPEKGSQSYGRLRAMLVEQGVPAKRIRFIHEAKTQKAQEALFAACRAGDVSVLIGSTEKMGTGTNVQKRLLALHHIDAPWKPSDMEQREGRALRPKNMNPLVQIYRYITSGTFDAFMFETLARKARFIAQMFSASTNSREVADLADVVLAYNEIRAIATGNPLLLEHSEALAGVKQLRILRSVFTGSVNRSKKAVRDQELREERLKRHIQILERNKADARFPTLFGPNSYERVETMVATMRKNRYAFPMVLSGSFRLHGAISGGQASFDVNIGYSSTGYSFVLSEKVWNSSTDKKVVKLIHDSLKQQWEDTEASIKRAKESILEARKIAAQHQHLVDTAVFERADDLTVAEHRLTLIERQMSEEAVAIAA